MAIIKNPLTVVSDGGSAILGTKNITANGTYDASSDNLDGYSAVSVDVSPTLFRSLVDGSITNITASDFGNVTSIREGAFHQCKQLVSVELSNYITILYTNAFRSCTKLETVVFGNSITTLFPYAFADSTKISKIVLPASITSIYPNAFRNCTGMTYFVIKNMSAPNLDNSNAFQSTNYCPIYVSTPDTYRAATNWSGVLDGQSNSRIFPLVNTISDLSNIDTTTYTKACVIGADESYKEYTYDGSQWNEVA